MAHLNTASQSPLLTTLSVFRVDLNGGQAIQIPEIEFEYLLNNRKLSNSTI